MDLPKVNLSPDIAGTLLEMTFCVNERSGGHMSRKEIERLKKAFVIVH
jgi:hypothetical protein